MRQLKILQSITNRNSLSLNKYLQEISKVDLLSAEEEYIVVQKIQEGDKTALELLVKSNLRFVVSIAKQYQSSGISLEDLINEGNMGLIKAASRFDQTRGFKFISYAVWWIRQYILTAISEQSRLIRLPLSQHQVLDKVKKAFLKLEQHYEREPSYAEVAEYLETSTDRISDYLRYSGNSVSIDSTFRQGEENTLLDILSNDAPAADSNLVLESRSLEIMKCINTLPPKENEIIRLFFGLDNHQPLTLEDISKRFCLTSERVRQVKEKALKHLLKYMRYNYIS